MKNWILIVAVVVLALSALAHLGASVVKPTPQGVSSSSVALAPSSLADSISSSETASSSAPASSSSAAASSSKEKPVSSAATSSLIRTVKASSNDTSLGCVSPRGSVTVVKGGKSTIYMQSKNGSGLSSLTVDGVEVGPSCTYTFSTVKSDHILEAVFGAGAGTACDNGIACP